MPSPLTLELTHAHSKARAAPPVDVTKTSLWLLKHAWHHGTQTSSAAGLSDTRARTSGPRELPGACILRQGRCIKEERSRGGFRFSPWMEPAS